MASDHRCQGRRLPIDAPKILADLHDAQRACAVRDSHASPKKAKLQAARRRAVAAPSIGRVVAVIRG
jgi:hypothetical protein